MEEWAVIMVSSKCAYCGELSSLQMSHAIPSAAFKALLTSGGGSAVAIPYGQGNAHRTSDTGAALLLCSSCEKLFNRNFDAPMINALKGLENAILKEGFRAKLEVDNNQLAHAFVAVAWRACMSSAELYSAVAIDQDDLIKLDTLLRGPADKVLRGCSARVSRLADRTGRKEGGFDQELMHQLVKTPETYRVSSKKGGSSRHFGLDWTMFGFLINLVVPRLPYPAVKSFGGLKRGHSTIEAKPVDILNYAPLRRALVSGYAANAEGRVSRSLQVRRAKRLSSE